MLNSRVLILIPARYESSRFPGKPLAKIGNKSMIEIVYQNSVDSGADVYVVTDDQRIEDHVNGFNGMILRVDDQVSSGTERAYLAFDRLLKQNNYDLIVNVQGDEPLLKGSELKKLFNDHLKSDFDIMTMVKKKQGFEGEFLNPDRVKVAYSPESSICHYFSRSSIPFNRDGDKDFKNNFWFLHIGIYSYKKAALEKFYHAPLGYLEDLEKLEQLRALEQGLSIGALETKLELIGVDRPEDILKIEGEIGDKKE